MDLESRPEGESRASEGWAAEEGQPPLAEYKSSSAPEADASILQRETAGPNRVWFGPKGLRAGWALLLFAVLVYLLATAFGTVLVGIVEGVLHYRASSASAGSTILAEIEWAAAVAAAMGLLSLAEHRRVGDYYLTDGRGLRHFAVGALVGFFALSVLVAVLAEGGWLHFGPVGLTGFHVLKYATLWGASFLLVGFFEEGTFRCYVQFTLTRGVNFWWAAGMVAAMCAYLLFTATGNGAWGIYAMGVLGVGPCLWISRTNASGNSFWQAAWAGSTGFGFIHTFNHGETWIGIFAAAAIGFVFCVSVRLTGSAWWAIGCHTAWDWAESFFYGTADSGFVAKGHLLSTVPAGPSLWSGGTDGPEGSVLVLPVIGLLLVLLLAMYGRSRPAANAEA